MLGIENYGIFLVSGIALNLTPGPDTMYILGRSVSQGKKAGILSVLGIINGAAVHTLLAAFGLSVVLAQSELAFNLMKYAGAGYLVYLGIKTLISKVNEFQIESMGRETSFKIYLQGLMTNLLNPKVALFYLAFLPQFVTPGQRFGPWPFVILGLTFITTGTIWCLILAIFSARLSEKLRQNKKLSQVMHKMTGVLFIGLGLNILRQKI